MRRPSFAAFSDAAEPASPSVLTGAGVGGQHLQAAQGVDIDQNLWHGRAPSTSIVIDHTAKARARSASGGQGLVFGVIFPCTSNILGVILFLRAPWIVGRAGIANGFGLAFVCCTCTFVTSLSLSAIATNGRILGGGAYYLISRSLGPALGAGVGLCFYMANSIGAAMYLMGCVEAWEMAAPGAQILPIGTINNTRVTALILLVGCLAVIAGGIKYVVRLGTFFLMVVFLVIFCMYLGCFIGPDKPGTQPSTYSLDVQDPDNGPTSITLHWGGIAQIAKNFAENWGPAWDVPQLGYPNDKTVYSFVSMMGLWFPANTGIMAGSNRSADLADPSGDIPRGTLIAQVSTSIVYLSFIILNGCVAPRHTLLNDRFFASTAAFPVKEVVIYGVMASTIGAGLTSLMSGTRLLSAIAGDNTLPILRHVKATPGKEPRAALVASGCLCACAILIGELNAVAPILTMFFLMCYTCVNSSCAIMEAVQDPNWRPTFKYYHWAISVFGAILCVWMMFAMAAVKAALAILFCLCVMSYAAYNSNAVRWGDGLQGIKFQLARNILIKMQLVAPTKSWRPQLLVITEATFVKSEDGAAELKILTPDVLKFVSQLKGGGGVTIVGGICDAKGYSAISDGGDFLASAAMEGVDDGRKAMKKVLTDFGIKGFGHVLYSDNFVEGVEGMIQVAGLGAFQPNAVMMLWPDEAKWRDRHEAGLSVRSKAVRTVDTTVSFDKVMFAAKGRWWPTAEDRLVGTIDVWWIVGDGGVLLLLPYLLKKSKVWRGCKTRLFVVADKVATDPEELGNELKAYVRDFHLDIDVFVQVLDTKLIAADAVASRQQGGNLPPLAALLPVHDGRDAGERASAAGVGLAADEAASPQPALLSREVSGALKGALARQLSEAKSLRGAGEEAAADLKDTASEKVKPKFLNSMEQLNSPKLCSVEELAVAQALGAVVFRESQDADLIVTNLPDMPPDESAFAYFEIVAEMTKELKRCLLVRGSAQDPIAEFA